MVSVEFTTNSLFQFSFPGKEFKVSRTLMDDIQEKASVNMPQGLMGGISRIRQIEDNMEIMEHTEEKPHTCETCNLACVCEDLYNQHKLVCSGEEPTGHRGTEVTNKEENETDQYICYNCHLIFNSEALWRNHIVSCKEKKPFVSQSDFSEDNKEDNERIGNKDIPQGTVKCKQENNADNDGHISIVPLEFKVEPDTENASQNGTENTSADKSSNFKVKISQNDQQYTCEYCEKIFRDRRQLMIHTRIHTGEKPYQCNQCDKAFSRQPDLLRHRRVHTGERPYPCDLCDLAFRNKAALNVHLRTHTDEKPYQCDQCEMAFRVKGALVRHYRRHTGEKPY